MYQIEIKYTVQGLLIYLAMASYLLAFAATLLKYRRTGHILYLLGFITAVFCFAYRWCHVHHIPMQNLFEVFLCLGMMIFPISLFCSRAFRIGGYGADMLIGAMVLLPAGFVFGAEPQQLPPALQSWLFIPHVAAYMLSYIFMAKAAFQALAQFAGKNPNPGKEPLNTEVATYYMVRAGFPLLTLGLVFGSYWGQLAWGDYWNWDPKELWSLAAWLVYVGYFHFRYMFGKRYPRINSAWVLAGMALIMITLLWANLSRLFPSLHSYAT
jgi:ABC-type transport system involved in cytochrome c biogenesis permease subunit